MRFSLGERRNQTASFLLILIWERYCWIQIFSKLMPEDMISAFNSQLCYSFLLKWGKLHILLFLQHFWLGFWYYLSPDFFFIYLDAVLNSVQSVALCSKRAEVLITPKSWLLKWFHSQYEWGGFHRVSRHLVPLVIKGMCWRSHILICA